MSVASADSLVALLRAHQLLTPSHLEHMSGQRSLDARTLLADLVRRGWLTPYQAELLRQGRAADLVLGAYRVLDTLGEGAMGKVFKARHVRMDRIVALKVLPTEAMANPRSVQRFEREVRAAAQLQHPNIVIAYDADQAGNVHFLAMEYIEGIDLAKLIKEKGPLPVATACDYVRQAALGLQHAHEKGLVHRDIKPSNLLLARSAEKATVKILDFGLARMASEVETAGRLTQLGRVVGTVDYISPEQADNARTADIRADIYSLGCTCFFLLTGRPPCLGADLVEKLSARLFTDPPPVRSVRADVPAGVERVLTRMMMRDPGQRYQTPAEVAVSLQSFVQATTVTATPPQPVPLQRPAVPVGTPFAATIDASVPQTSPIRRVRKPRPSRRGPVMAVGVGVLLLGLVLTVFLLFRSGPQRTASKPKGDAQSVADKKPAPPRAIKTYAELAQFHHELRPGGFQGRTEPARDILLQLGGGTAESEAAVEAGLRWLAYHQAPDGHWSLDHFHLHTRDPLQPEAPPVNDFSTGQGIKQDVAGTALALLPFLAAGETPRPPPGSPDKTSRYDWVVRSGLSYLLSSQQPDGSFGSQPTQPNHTLYVDCLASMVLSEAYGLTADAALHAPAQRALDHLVWAQVPATQGWSYVPRTGRGDTSITGWAVQALHAGQVAGLRVPESSLAGAGKWLDSCASADRGGYGYTGPVESFSMTGAGLFARQLLGWGPLEPGLAAGIPRLEKEPPGTKPNIYAYYYATQAVFHRGGTAWERWNPRMRDLLVRSQDATEVATERRLKGSWGPRGDPHAASGGRIMVTSLALLTLQVYYRHVPLHLRAGVGQ